jgi:hypothetical protein
MLISKFVKKYTKLYINLQKSASPCSLSSIEEVGDTFQTIHCVCGANHIRVRRHVGANGRC